MIKDNRLFFPATNRNRKCIGDLLSTIPLKGGSILEIGSGSGEHAVVFQKRFPEILWQSSDPLLIHRNSIAAWIDYEGLNFKMPQPIDINVENIPWIIPSKVKESLHIIISINMIHIACWNCTKSLFRESSKLLKNGQFLILYGPFKIGNKHTSQSNNLFDKSLKMQNKLWGIRNLEEVSNEAIKNSFVQEKLCQMPANNFSVIYRKVSK
ncbi:conserved hypothetical protein [Prochlorococcus marinus str. MIT 9515]|uniref:SAM-dependent methyltransferase n=1 Tax=Prochlorococcus marinus (strain MIT 9515) TaxID=167542 RepID=A2BYA8_PROM5|nr:conserved hypothetical protein [Prochlorococcus marinus str. MIT 9515]